MSKLIRRLEKAGQETAIPMGFGTGSRRDEADAPIMLIGRVTPDELAKDADLSAAQVDAFIVSLKSLKAPALRKIEESLRDRLWGASVSGLDADKVTRLKDSGCDFVVFDAGDTAAEVLSDEELGKVLAIGPGLSDDEARAIQELPIDGMMFTPENELLPLTVQKLIEIQLTRSLVDKPFAMAIESELGPPELESLRNVGISALVVGVSPVELIDSIKQAISTLPRRKPKAPSGHSVLAHPTAGMGLPAEQTREDDDDF